MMHYYTQADVEAKMRTRIRELEEIAASAELELGVAWDEIDDGRQRERRLLWTVIALGTVAVIAVAKVSWMAMGRQAG